LWIDQPIGVRLKGHEDTSRLLRHVFLKYSVADRGKLGLAELVNGELDKGGTLLS